MNISVILAHPNSGSFNRALADYSVLALKDNGHDVVFHDLYEEHFNPVLPYQEISPNVELDPLVQRHCDEIKQADGIIIVHPSWWGQPPAILKGWVDRVMRVGVAYRFEEGPAGIGKPVGMLRAEHALVINTSNTPREIELQMYGDTLETIWNKSVLSFCGVKKFHRKLYSPVLVSTADERARWLEDCKNTVSEIFTKSGEMRISA